MKKIKGPAIFLAQFASNDEPFNNLKNISSWASKLGYTGIQLPSWDNRLIDLEIAAESKDYAMIYVEFLMKIILLFQSYLLICKVS